jgi:2-polyprenyl-3-methyl-5-hydroxy-6-metoxy-1,4-benzoquinol methylase
MDTDAERINSDAERINTDADRINELRRIVEEVKTRVRARYPQPGEEASSNGQSQAAPVAPADLMPILHARDAAQSKIAAIGSVNPRAAGLANRAIQVVKKVVARSLGWFVREQVVFNREIVAAVEAILEALNEHNRAVVGLASQMAPLADIPSHWVEWRAGWEQKLTANEIQFLRSVADLQASFQYRVTQLEASFRDMLKLQHSDYLAALERTDVDIQKRLWADMDKIRWQHERVIHTELRLIRQRARAAAEVSAARPQEKPIPAAETPAMDYARFSERFRGSEEEIRKSQNFYRPWFEGCENVLDIGCGRGEFLDLMREMDVPAKGIDLSEESVMQCRARGFNAETADLFTFLNNAADCEFDGIFCSQVVEHLDPLQLPRMISLCAEKLTRNGVIAIETPNPDCLAIFATFFYLDPTHTRPAPSQLLDFYLTEAGFGAIGIHLRSPAAEIFPELLQLPEAARSRFFGGLDYAIVGRKL